MNLSSELRAQFTINILLGDPKSGSAARTFLSLAGYNIFHFLDEDLLLSRLAESPPHVLFFEPQGLVSEPGDFLAKIHQVNSEILAVAVVGAEQLAQGQKKKWKVHDYVVKSEHLEEVLLLRLDHVCASLFLEYQNEELIRDFEVLEKKSQEAPPPNLPPPRVTQSFTLHNELRQFREAAGVEDLFARGIGILGMLDLHVVFFRFVQASGHFVPLFFSDQGDQATARWSPDLTSFHKMKLHPAGGDGLEANLSDWTEGPHFFFTLDAADEGIPYGFFLIWDPQDKNLGLARGILDIFNLVFRNMVLTEKTQELGVIDLLTGLYLGKELLQNLEGEVSRARRNRSAISLIKVAFDHLNEIEQSFGPSQKELLVKNFAELLRGTGRLHDRIFRSGENEFSLVLPDCPHQGAAIRAERLRQLVETSSFRMNGIQASISCGISEFPHFVQDATRLIETAEESLKFIQERGGNKTCLYQPKEDFRPEYTSEEGP